METDQMLAHVLAELMEYEPIFHRPQKARTRAEFDRMMAASFWEIGASGRRYSRAYVLDELDRRLSQPQSQTLESSEFCCRQLAPDVFLLTYNLTQNGVRRTRRTTIWQRSSDGWRIVFHQGTIIQD